MKRKYTVKKQLTKSPGIYIITCEFTEKVYIGETLNLSLRLQKHFSLLRKGKHSNPILQNIFNKYGEESFTVDILEYLTTTDELELKTIEKSWQDKYPTCISMDSNEIFVVERSEEWKENQRKQLDEIRNSAISKCLKPIIIYDIITKKLVEYKSFTEACLVIEQKHLYKNIKEGILIPYNNKVGFLKESFDISMLSKIITTQSQISRNMGEYNLYNLLSDDVLYFTSKAQFSLKFSSSKNNNLYDNYYNKIDWNYNCTKAPKTLEALYAMDIEITNTKRRFSSICNVKLWYESLKIFRNNVHLSELTGVERRKLATILKLRSKEEWILNIETAIARLKSV